MAAQMADPRVASTAGCWVENLAVSKAGRWVACSAEHLAGQMAGWWVGLRAARTAGPTVVRKVDSTAEMRVVNWVALSVVQKAACSVAH